MSKKKIVLFGGTFDPIHNGHLHASEGAFNEIVADRFFFIPCKQSPHKSSSSFASNEQRLRMLELAIAIFEWGEISKYELEKDEPSFSWRTVEYFRSIFVDCDIFWLLGFDQWEKINSWVNVDYLRENVTFVVFRREECEEFFRHDEKYRVIFLDGIFPCSSTEIRDNFYNGDDILNKDLLSLEVYNFIKTENIY